MSAMYAPLKSAALDKLVKRRRSATGSNLVPTNVKGVRALLKALKQGQQVGILPDQRAQAGSGIFSPFFGLPAYTMTLFTSLNQKAKARVFVCFAERVKGGWCLHFDEAPDSINSDQQIAVDGLNTAVEHAVLKAPSQYQWEYKRFATQPDGSNVYEHLGRE